MRSYQRDWLVYCSIGAAIAVFVAANTVNALNKGGDASDFFAGGARVLHGAPLYDGSGPAQGFVGPPFQALFFAPFAAVAQRSAPAAKLAWYAVNLALLGAGLVCWYYACSTAMSRWPQPEGRRVVDIVAAVVAVLLPLQTNFEHQNMNALLLGVLGGGAWTLMVGRPHLAGMIFGFAAALKVFPGLVIVYLAVRGLWKALASAVATAIALTLLPAVIYGPAVFSVQVSEWLRISTAGWPSRFNNQSLIAALDRLTGAWKTEGARTVADAPIAAVLFAALACVLVALAVPAFSRRDWRLGDVPHEIAAVIALSLLLSPIAWDHYWTLLFPAFLLMRFAAHPALLGTAATRTFWVAAILVTGISRVSVGSSGWNVARRLSVCTAAAILLYVMLLRLSHSVSTSVSTDERADGQSGLRANKAGEHLAGRRP